MLGIMLPQISLHAQNQRALEIIKQQTNQDELQRLAREWEERDARRYREAVAAARKNNWPIRVEEERQTIEIYALDKDGNPLYRTTYNNDAATSTQTDKLHSGGTSGLNLEGNQMTIGEWDGGATRATHENLSPRVTQRDGATSLSSHATHVAGTLMGDGVPSSSAKGMAPQADLDAYDWNSDNSEMATAASNGLLVSNHSYGFISGWNFSNGSWSWWGNFSKSTQEDDDFGQYGGSARGWDIIANNAPFYLIVKAAGNDRGDGPPNVGNSFTNFGSTFTYNPSVNPNRSPAQDGGSTGYDCISDMGIAKNVLTVGAANDVTNYTGPGSVSMSSFSGWGPADDGRIKPDICGNGVGLFSSTATANNSYSSFSGTSMASPNVAGSLLLLQEHYMNLHSDTALRAATLKALAIHTAREAGSAIGPDYQYGWGLLSTADAAELISLDTINTNVIQERSLANNGSFSFQFKALGNEPIRATIAWNDPAGFTKSSLDDTTPVLVNDLDLRISDSTSTFKPYRLNPASPASAATTGDNRVDNVEQVYIANPVAGRTYTLTVNHKGTLNSSQRYALIISGQQLASCPRPTNLQATNITDTTAILRWASSAMQYEVRHGIQGFNLGSGGTTVTTSADSLSVNGLQPSRKYDFYVRAICAAGDTSFWSKMTFATQCGSLSPVTLPYLQDWETGSGSFQGDSVFICSPNEIWELKTSLPQGRASYGTQASDSKGAGAITLDRTPSGAVNFNELILTLNLSNYQSSNRLELFFDYREHQEEQHPGDSAWIRGNNNANWIGIYDLYANRSSVFQTVGSLDVDSILGAHGQTVSSTFQLRLGQEDNFPAGTDGYTFDNIFIRQTPTCLQPSQLSASNISSNGATLNWQENDSATQWQVAYALSGAGLSSATRIIANAKPYSLSGLAAATDYEWYVRSICGSGDTSLWSSGSPFKTLCSPVLTAPQNYDFENTTRSGANFTNCWKRSTGVNPTWEINQGSTPSNSTGPFYDNTLQNATGSYLYLETSSPSGLGDTSSFSSAGFDISGLFQPYLEFYYHMYGATMGTLELLVSDDGGATYTTAWTKTGQQHSSTTAAYTKATLNLGSYGDTVRFKFKGTAGSSWTGDIALDDIAVFDSAKCTAPSSLLASFNSLTSATLQWQDVSGSQKWEMQYDTLGVALSGGIITTQTTLGVNNLLPTTTYRFRVRAFCPSGDTSQWSQPKQFTTPCAPQARVKNNPAVYLNALGVTGNAAANVDSGTAALTCAFDSLWTVPAQWNCSQLGNQSGTLFVVNRFGDTASQAFTARVIDTVAPAASGLPANATLAFCNATFTYAAPTANDNCAGTSTVTQTQGLPSGATFPVGTTVNRFRLSDTRGNNRTVSFSVTVNGPPNALLPTQRDFCLNADTADFSFNQNITYTGSGIVSNNQFVPALAGVGKHALVFSMPASGGCSFTDTLEVEVLPIPNPVVNDVGNDVLQTSTFNSYQWWRNGATIPGATNQSYQYTLPGNYQVEVTDSLCPNISAAFAIDSNDIGVGEFALSNFKLFPNPGSKEVTLQWPEHLNPQQAELHWYNSQGQKVQRVKVPAGARELRMRVTHLPKGLYYLQWHSAQQFEAVGTWLKK